MFTYRFPRGTYAHLPIHVLAQIAAVMVIRINRHNTLIVKTVEPVEFPQPVRCINVSIGCIYSTLEIIGETDKAYNLKRKGDKRFDGAAGITGWMPKSALKPYIPPAPIVRDETYSSEYVLARWFRPDNRQEKLLGLAE